MNLNKVFLIGRLTNNPQLRMTSNGKPVVSFGLATNRVWINQQGQRQEDTQYHNIVVWGRQAEIANQFLRKGIMVFIEGRLQTRNWQDRENQTRRVTEIIAERFQLGPRAASLNEGQHFQDDSKNDFSQEINAQELPEIDIEEEEIKPEDIPF